MSQIEPKNEKTTIFEVSLQLPIAYTKAITQFHRISLTKFALAKPVSSKQDLK